MKQSFLLQLITTAIVIGGIYTGVLYANEGVDQWRDKTDPGLSQKESVQPVEKERSSTEAVVSSTPSVNDDSHKKAAYQSVTIVGTQSLIDLSDTALATKQIGLAWNAFYQEDALHESLSWTKGPVNVFAYYDQIAADFSKARLTIGYPVSRLIKTYEGIRISTQKGQAQYFDMMEGKTPDQAWEALYPRGVLLERYQASALGDVTNIDSVVIK